MRSKGCLSYETAKIMVFKTIHPMVGDGLNNFYMPKVPSVRV